jgi:hypothetical protein
MTSSVSPLSSAKMMRSYTLGNWDESQRRSKFDVQNTSVTEASQALRLDALVCGLNSKSKNSIGISNNLEAAVGDIGTGTEVHCGQTLSQYLPVRNYTSLSQFCSFFDNNDQIDASFGSHPRLIENGSCPEGLAASSVVIIVCLS